MHQKPLNSSQYNKSSCNSSSGNGSNNSLVVSNAGLCETQLLFVSLLFCRFQVHCL